MITDKEYFYIQFNIADAFEWAMHNTHTSYASITLNEHQASLQLYTFSTYDGPSVTNLIFLLEIHLLI